MFLAGGRVSPGLATVIANSQPLLAALLGQFVLEEGLGRWQILGMLLAFAGILELALPTLQSAPAESSSAVGVAFVLLGAVGVAGGNVAMKRSSALLDPIAATGWQLLIGSLLLFLAWAAGTSSQPIRIESAFVFALLGLAVLGTAVAFALWLALLPRAPLNTLNIFSFLTPVFALVIGAAFYDERLGGDQVVGAAVVLLGAALANRVAHSRPS
jgi:drug/metabolite transporter (DMT)-like permease